MKALIFLLIPAILAASAIALMYILYRMTFSVPRQETCDPYLLPQGRQYRQRHDQMLAMIRGVDALPYENIWIFSEDGLRLRGRYYHAAEGAPVQILFHGYRSNGLRDFCGGLKLALDSGCNALLVDQRAHGQSQGRALTFGVKERQDCVCWAKYAEERFGSATPIFLVGLSMGASTVMMASELDLPANVAGIIADCGYASPAGIIQKVMRDRGYPVSWIYPLLRLGGRIFGGFDIESCSAKTALRQCRTPLLLLHGEDDRFVPCDMSRENFEACSSTKKLVTFPEAGHGLSYLTDEAAYKEAVLDFIRGACEEKLFLL